MFQLLKEKRNFFFLILALLAPLAYHGLNKLYYNLLSLLPIINEEAVNVYIQENPMFLDAIFCALLILLVWPFYKMVQKDSAARGFFKNQQSFTAHSLFVSFVIAMGAGGISSLWQLVARTILVADASFSQGVQQFDAAFASSPAPTAYFWSFLSVVLFGPIVEELIFRGLTFSGLERIWGGLAASLISGLYFGLWHSIPIQIVYTAVLGIILGIVYNETRNMWFPMMIHFINNLSSNLPPIFENEVVYAGLLVVKVVAIFPMLYWLYCLVKKKQSIHHLRLSFKKA